MKLYYYEGSTRKGPIPSVRLRELARKGEVAPETLIETVLGMRFRADEAGSYVSGLSLEKEFANLRAVPPEPSQEREIKPEIKPKAGAAVVPAPELEAEFDAGPAEPKADAEAEPVPAVESQPTSASAEPEPRKTVSGSSVSAAKRPLEEKTPPKDAPEDAIEWKELELIDVGGGTPQAEPTLDPFEALTNGLNAAPRYEQPAAPPRRAANSAPRQTVLTANRKEPEPPAPAKSKGSRLNAVIFAAALIALIAMSFDISFSAILFFFACCIVKRKRGRKRIGIGRRAAGVPFAAFIWRAGNILCNNDGRDRRVRGLRRNTDRRGSCRSGADPVFCLFVRQEKERRQALTRVPC